MTSQKMICIKSEIIFFAISISKYETVIGEAYLILDTNIISSNGKNHYYIYREGTDLGLCNIDNFITIAECREQQIKSVLDD